MNALSRELRSTLASTVRELESDPGIRVLILTGAGDRAFTAGLDLKELGVGASISDAVEIEDPVKPRQAEAWGLVNRVRSHLQPRPCHRG